MLEFDLQREKQPDPNLHNMNADPLPWASTGNSLIGNGRRTEAMWPCLLMNSKRVRCLPTKKKQPKSVILLITRSGGMDKTFLDPPLQVVRCRFSVWIFPCFYINLCYKNVFIWSRSREPERKLVVGAGSRNRSRSRLDRLHNIGDEIWFLQVLFALLFIHNGKLVCDSPHEYKTKFQLPNSTVTGSGSIFQILIRIQKVIEDWYRDGPNRYESGSETLLVVGR